MKKQIIINAVMGCALCILFAACTTNEQLDDDTILFAQPL